MPHRSSFLIAGVLAASLACGQGAEEQVVYRSTMDDLDGVLTRTGVSIDTAISTQGAGSLRIEATEPTTVRLFELDEVDAESAQLIYRARLRTEDVEGPVFLEMWCRFPQGEFFSRALHQPLSGTTEWTTQQTPFRLEAGQNPQAVKLNVVVSGSGTVWVDDIELACVDF